MFKKHAITESTNRGYQQRNWNYAKNQMKIQELKSKITEMKVSLDVPKDRFEMAEVRNSVLK